MTQNLNDMVAVASGSSATVTRWAQLLRRAAISYHIATATWTGDERLGNSELWVVEGLAEEARSVIRSAGVSGARLIW